ncbi:MAG: leucine--tRNA ligase [Firmicutes bacterium]|nr:leucine--tRNA ligase [Bacillota bacterium]
MQKYHPKEIEPKWQEIWEKEHRFEARDDRSKPKFYALIEFPYPSGDGLHVGHLRPYTALDIISRKKRKEGYNVLFPIGWDAFGLPTENYAIKTKVHPRIVTERNIARFKSQLKKVGYSFDWSREVNTTDPGYYKWTQWIFLKLFEKGLAYKTETTINWCTSCKVVLANEEVVKGVCERCGSEVIQRPKKQWLLKITAYAEKLLQGLETVDYIERAKVQQTNWIGKSEGANVGFIIEPLGKEIRIYTTRPDTLFGATYMVIAPEHPLIQEAAPLIENIAEVDQYIAGAKKKSNFERAELAKDKTGVQIKGIQARNPVNGKLIPVFISDYVLMTYGTGAIMAVPGHDTRDWEFAKKFNLPIIEVVKGGDIEKEAFVDIEDGVMVNSGFLDGLKVSEAIEKIIRWLEEKGVGRREQHYKLRDWIFSRQRYWGEPIPLVECEKCGWVPIPEDQLPLLLPETEHFEPGAEGESPLFKMQDWVNTTCPKCGGPAKRETDTMPQWAGSSWYFLRYTDPRNDKCLASKEALEYWMPVNWYNGGMEHTTLHLLYSRFWHKFLYDIGVVPTPEPYMKRTSHGMILGSNNEKMSKSRGNVVNPDVIIEQYGADSVRLFEMFIGDFERDAPWSDESLRGCRKFLERVWRLGELLAPGNEFSKDLENDIHKTIQKVSLDIEKLKFNTAISAIMTLVNKFYGKGQINQKELATLLVLMNPFTPHITEEMWVTLGLPGKISEAPWPKWDPDKIIDDEVELVIQFNGKIKGKILIAPTATQEEATAAVNGDEDIQKLLAGKQVLKVIYVPGRIYNMVIK